MTPDVCGQCGELDDVAYYDDDGHAVCPECAKYEAQQAAADAARVATEEAFGGDV